MAACPSVSKEPRRNPEVKAFAASGMKSLRRSSNGLTVRNPSNNFEDADYNVKLVMVRLPPHQTQT